MYSYTVFKDDRLPHIEIRWHGGMTFNVYREGKEVDVFTSGHPHINFDYARSLAESHFDMWLNELEETPVI